MKTVTIRRLSVTLAMTCLLLFYGACSGDSILPEVLQKQQPQQQTPQARRRELVSEGVVTGPDFRMCPSPCCGGWIIRIDSTYYTFSNFPDNSGIDPTTQIFPLNVSLAWSLDSALNCNHIAVRWMRAQDSPLPMPMPTSSE